jgi:hypothetical protein
MFSVLSRLGSPDEEEVRTAFKQAEEHMTGYTAGKPLHLLPADQCGLDAMDRACDELSELAPAFQQRALLAGLAAISADDRIDPPELEAFRAFAAAMRIPVPPNIGFGQIG